MVNTIHFLNEELKVTDDNSLEVREIKPFNYYVIVKSLIWNYTLDFVKVGEARVECSKPNIILFSNPIQNQPNTSPLLFDVHSEELTDWRNEHTAIYEKA